MSQRRSAAAWLLGVALLLPPQGPSGAQSAAQGDEFRLVVGTWCPFECSPDQAGGLKGFLTDIAVTVLERQGFRTTLVQAPYRRGVSLVMEDPVHVLVGIPKEDAPGLVFPELEQARTTTSILVRAGETWRYRGPRSLLELRAVGIVKDFDYGELNEVINHHPGIFSSVPAVPSEHGSGALRNLERLLAGRLDAVVHDEYVAAFELARLGRAAEVITAGALQPAQALYVAFSPRLPGAREHAARMAAGTRQLRASGELARILARYGVQDWERASAPAP